MSIHIPSNVRRRNDRLVEAFTRKHYEVIAEAIETALLDIEQGDKPDAAIYRMANQLATVFKNDNPNFDKQRFLKACGLS